MGAFLVRLLHRFVLVTHGLFLYVDDGLLLVPGDCALATMFLVALGVPLSYEKLSLGQNLAWIGWRLQVGGLTAVLPEEKKAHVLSLLKPLLGRAEKTERAALSRVIGLLVWYTSGAKWLRPWLQPL